MYSTFLSHDCVITFQLQGRSSTSMVVNLVRLEIEGGKNVTCVSGHGNKQNDN